MISIKTSKIVAICLLTAVLIGFGHATPPVRPLTGDVEYEMNIKGGYPRVGESFEVVFRVRLKENNQLYLLPEEIVQQGYIVSIYSKPSDSVQITNREVSVPILIPGEWKEFSTQCIITKMVKDFWFHAEIRLAAYKNGPGLSRHLWLVDSLTGQYGTKEERLKKMSNVFWKYNHLDAQWLSEPDPRWEESNRKIAEEMRKFEPALTDSEALCLHQNNYLLIINAIGDSTATDSERVEHLLKAGWLKAQRTGAEVKEKWLNDFMEKNQRRWGDNYEINMLYLK